ncbi:hypothetical protein PRIPAC_75689 [Pristionchus pacificus]|uniref:Uncharacterized protein n=1 Tax=Pristionchus pacificus TaxID=54126 RepID=A0A2A6CA25_PRIPA|nr:hypothetical protein PRIPAC_75689 [Pristionchus pacificus]|eukprot:PDM74946.1 hypothetical protein PRIPAC_40327 [Pristionchus pacificus]
MSSIYFLIRFFVFLVFKIKETSLRCQVRRVENGRNETEISISRTKKRNDAVTSIDGREKRREG